MSENRPQDAAYRPLVQEVDLRSTPGLNFEAVLPRIRRIMFIALAAIVTLDLLASVGAAEGAPYTLTRFFDGDLKVNFPTGYKTTFLLMAFALLVILSAWARRVGDPFTRGWQLLAAVTGFAFVDETVYLHQSISRTLQEHLHTDGVLRFAWTILYLPAAFAVGIVLLRYITRLEARSRLPLLSGGALYAFAAVGLEPVKSHLSSSRGEDSLAFKLAAFVSDSLEMIGLTILVVVLLTLLAQRVRHVSFALRQSRS